MTDPKEISPHAEPELVRRALGDVLKSDGFVRSDRLKAFLTYIVEETLEGRAKAILGKTIAQDVYDRDPAKTENAENLVRVDAGRLRRQLDAYYANQGSGDRLQIVIDSGGYAPRFVDRQAPDKRKTAGRAPSRKRLAASLALAGAFALVFGAVILWMSQRDADVPVAQSEAESDARQVQRQALAAKSTAAVQAANLCDQARGFLFPIAEVGSQRTAESIFKRAIDTDPASACGYAGRAHALATLARLAGPAPIGDELRSQASAMADRAVALEPTSGWSQSAAAWSAYAENDLAEAIRLSGLAMQLSPRDGNVLDFRALISVVTGDFQASLAATDPKLSRDFGSFRYARRNIRAVVLFHTGDYAESISSLEDAISNGDPVSALTLTFLTVGHFKAGNLDQARAYATQLAQEWPDARPDIGLRRLYSTPDLAQAVLEPLAAAGWRPRDDAL